MSRRYAEGPEAAIDSWNNLAPVGTKVRILSLGYLQGDDGYMKSGSNKWTASQGNPPSHKLAYVQMYATLIDHPTAGLILWDTGPGIYETYMESWASVCDIFEPINRSQVQGLDKAIELAGYNINDVKHIVLSHLHMDHAGGLQYFKGHEDITVWVHEIEMKHAYWVIGTGIDRSSYMDYYLGLMDYNWTTFDDTSFDLFPGITLYLIAGHTPGLIMMRVNLRDSGTIIFASDHLPLSEAYEPRFQPGWDLRDHAAWHRSTLRLKQLQRLTNATVVFGHDPQNLAKLVSKHPKGYIT